MAKSPPATVLSWVLVVHLFRVFAAFGIQARKAGLPLSDAALRETVGLDVLGAALALAAIVALLNHSAAGS